jgi:argonaute-like protein implicated in RNA metabolism and viral defense
VIHRDGYFRGDEKKVLIDWAREIGAEFYLVEILKSGTPRIYGINNGQYVQATKGSALELSDTETFLVSTPPPFENATPAPLHLRTQAPFTIEQAIHSVLSLTLLHHGSVRPPRLPVCQFITATESPIWH